MSFHSTTPLGPKHTQSIVWNSPSWIVDKLGGADSFDLDPCQSENIVTLTAKNYYFEKDDGLSKNWYGMVFCNFPYSDSKAWLSKCKNEYLAGNCEIIVLCYIRSETKAWQENVGAATGINLIKKRIKFLNQNGIEKSNGNAPSCLIAFGENAFQRIKNVDGILVRIDKNI